MNRILSGKTLTCLTACALIAFSVTGCQPSESTDSSTTTDSQSADGTTDVNVEVDDRKEVAALEEEISGLKLRLEESAATEAKLRETIEKLEYRWNDSQKKLKETGLGIVELSSQFSQLKTNTVEMESQLTGALQQLADQIEGLEIPAAETAPVVEAEPAVEVEPAQDAAPAPAETTAPAEDVEEESTDEPAAADAPADQEDDGTNS